MTSGPSPSSRRNKIRNPFRYLRPPTTPAAETLPGFSDLVESDPLNPGSTSPPTPQVPTEEQRPQGYRRRRTTLSRSTRGWSRAVVWSLIGLTAFSLVYGFSARIDNSITTTGQIRPMGGLADVMPPYTTFIDQVLVKEGQLVKAGALLVVLRNQTSIDQLKGLRIQQGLWRKRARLTAIQLGLPPISGAMDESTRQLNVEQKEVSLRLKAAIEENNRIRLNRQQAEADLRGLKERLSIDTNITRRMENLLLQGAISKLEVDRQHERLSELASAVQRAELEVASAIRREDEGQYKLNHISVGNDKELYTNYDNARQQLIEANNRIKEVEERIKLGRIHAPKAGAIFDLNAHVGEMAVATRTLLKIVPQQGLDAEIHVSDNDIGWIKLGMPVEVRVNSFPFTEYGSIKGKLIKISKDVFPPDMQNPQQYYKGRIRLQRQVLSHYGKDYPLSPGMAITALVQTGTRPAISLVTNQFTTFIDSARAIR
ncbi:MAG: hypothetical protein RLZZ158_1604 [Cyanobacteriota bacterium]|jgi:HlyD family secretion protein